MPSPTEGGRSERWSRTHSCAVANVRLPTMSSGEERPSIILSSKVVQTVLAGTASFAVPNCRPLCSAGLACESSPAQDARQLRLATTPQRDKAWTSQPFPARATLPALPSVLPVRYASRECVKLDETKMNQASSSRGYEAHFLHGSLFLASGNIHRRSASWLSVRHPHILPAVGHTIQQQGRYSSTATLKKPGVRSASKLQMHTWS